MSLGVPVLVSALPPDRFTMSLSGSGGKSYDLNTYNRFEFNGDGWILSSGRDATVSPINVPFAVCNRVTFDTQSRLDIGDIKTEALRYDGSSRGIILEAEKPETYRVTVYSSLGVMVMDSGVDAAGIVSIRGFVPGVYVAVATDGHSRMTLKFVVR